MLDTNEYPILIAVTGPESTGKSRIVRELSQHYNCPAIPEYAREYLAELDRPYNYDDVLQIARGQQQLMEEIINHQQSDLIIFDTELTVTRIWCEFKYERCHPWIIDQQQIQNIDHYLLMNIDLPWQPDPLREHPDKRNELFEYYKNALEKQKWSFDIVSGTGDVRFENAVKIIDQRFK